MIPMNRSPVEIASVIHEHSAIHNTRTVKSHKHSLAEDGDGVATAEPSLAVSDGWSVVSVAVFDVASADWVSSVGVTTEFMEVADEASTIIAPSAKRLARTLKASCGERVRV